MRKGIQFAKPINARVTGFCVGPELRHFGFDADIGPEFRKQAAAAVQTEVAKNLLAIEKAAEEAGMPCETDQEKSDQPYEAIIAAAQKRQCDLIIMAPTDGGGCRGCGSAARLKRC